MLRSLVQRLHAPRQRERVVVVHVAVVELHGRLLAGGVRAQEVEQPLAGAPRRAPLAAEHVCNVTVTIQQVQGKIKWE